MADGQNLIRRMQVQKRMQERHRRRKFDRIQHELSDELE